MSRNMMKQRMYAQLIVAGILLSSCTKVSNASDPNGWFAEKKEERRQRKCAGRIAGADIQLQLLDAALKNQINPAKLDADALYRAFRGVFLTTIQNSVPSAVVKRPNLLLLIESLLGPHYEKPALKLLVDNWTTNALNALKIGCSDDDIRWANAFLESSEIRMWDFLGDKTAFMSGKGDVDKAPPNLAILIDHRFDHETWQKVLLANPQRPLIVDLDSGNFARYNIGNVVQIISDQESKLIDALKKSPSKGLKYILFRSPNFSASEIEYLRQQGWNVPANLQPKRYYTNFRFTRIEGAPK